MPSNHRLVGLDLLRFFAAFIVMLFHLGFWSWAPETSTPKSILQGAASYPELTPFAWWGWVGVEIFFVISGFVIANSASHASQWSFARGRFRRLFPAAVICASITLGVALLIQWAPTDVLLVRYLKTITFWPMGGWIDGVYWTLGIEIAFYALVFGLLVIRRFDWIEPVMATIGVGSSIVWVAQSIFVSQIAAPMGVISSRWWQLLLVHHGMYFAAGVFLWLGLLRQWTPFRLIVLLLCLAGGVLPILAEANSKVATLDLGAWQWIPVAAWLAAVGVIWATVRFDAWIAARLKPSLAAVSTVGLSTYPLYLVHDVVGAATLRSLLTIGVDRFVALALTGGAMVGIALLVTVSAERWLRDRLSALGVPARTPPQSG